jgi:N-terminal domain of anti-restriction factor ArdC
VVGVRGEGLFLPLWLTFKQALELGGNVRKGEHGELVVYTNRITRTETDEKGAEIEREIPFLKATPCSVYLGHVRPEDTYWYLIATPDLLRAAGSRFTPDARLPRYLPRPRQDLHQAWLGVSGQPAQRSRPACRSAPAGPCPLPRSARLRPAPAHSFADITLSAGPSGRPRRRQRVPTLSVYLGHVRPEDTYWYR